MKRQMKKGLAIVFALIMVFAMSTSAFAVSGIPGNNGQYLEGTAIPPTTDADCSSYVVTVPTASTSANVTLVIEAGDAFEDYAIQEDSAFREIMTVNLTATSAKHFTVENVLETVNGMSSGFNFSIKETSSGPYLEYVEYGDYT